MSSVNSPKIPSSITTHYSSAEHWSKQTGVPTALLLAFIDQESMGNVSATRYEPGYERTYVKNNPKVQKIIKQCRITSKQAATSYGLLQVMFPLAFGYGARSVQDALDNSLRYGAAHIANLAKKHYTEGERYYGENHIKKIAAAYNGCSVNDIYPKDIVRLYSKYNTTLHKKEA